ncbi:4-hydroxybenzoate octaprenyltransferase [Rickettsia bellii]|uniref:4-hydroxybenzoate octaprenyltransferase n=2 Tax=Rickettsia bellii TaxID=33990 RepID=Q1RJH6_RICBR|nr:4-hydroxybenzoate octaprenyltransferase [Rickettsia bellii]ABE04488.1 4-hydroxybenzoate octaprenyltransferase [Rickettsia bellii RML369-C]ABV79468.1 prenyltransferase [Rickettsia bellii OSU 85-389]KJV92180.1 4-hydroxybenzoate polyprenyl transferase [Rickettsia bellii str. RML Mogi]
MHKFLLTFKLMRADKPVAYLLVFFPALFGLLLANPSRADLIYLLPLFILGSITTRSSGCIINDIFDQKFDKHVARTKNRPLASGALSIKYAIGMLFILSILSLFILLTLSRTAIYIGFFTVMMISIYPLMKRVTYLPQVFLGFTFNLGTLIAYATVQNKLDIAAITMYLACCLWTIGYDTIYGFMDIKDDKKIGVKSLSICLENKAYKFWLYIFYVGFILLFISAAGYNLDYLPILGASTLLILQIATLEIHNPANCMTRFKANHYAGLLLSLSFC